MKIHINQLRALAEWLEKDGWELVSHDYKEGVRAVKGYRVFNAYRALQDDQHLTVSSSDGGYGVLRAFLKYESRRKKNR